MSVPDMNAKLAKEMADAFEKLRIEKLGDGATYNAVDVATYLMMLFNHASEMIVRNTSSKLLKANPGQTPDIRDMMEHAQGLTEFAAFQLAQKVIDDIEDLYDMMNPGVTNA